LLQFDYGDGIEVLPALTDPSPGSRPEGLRIISDRLFGYKYYIGVEGERKTSGKIDVYIHNQEIEKIENGTLTGSDGEIYHIAVTFDPVRQSTRIRLLLSISVRNLQEVRLFRIEPHPQPPPPRGRGSFGTCDAKKMVKWCRGTKSCARTGHQYNFGIF